ncbi:hypothetical protein Tco_0623654, partial [Tanacetum coccineum]
MGGWYSYRASKAAPNQLLHANVPKGQLLEPASTAERIIEVVGAHGPADSGTFWDWDDKPIV